MSDDGFLTQEEIDALLGKTNQPQHPSYEEKFPGKLEMEEEEFPNLELILDFPLTVSVRLGEVKKRLREVRKLSPGTVVELDRPINEPVEIFVGGKLIARGEVVVVGENFGIKITHILDPLERIKKLR